MLSPRRLPSAALQLNCRLSCYVSPEGNTSLRCANLLLAGMDFAPFLLEVGRWVPSVLGRPRCSIYYAAGNGERVREWGRIS